MMDKFYCPEIVLMDCREKMAIYFQHCVQIYESPSEVLYRVADLDSPLYFFEKHQLSKQTLGKLIMELIDSKQYRLSKLKFSEVLTIANKMQTKIEHQICPLSFSSDSKNFDFSLGCQKVIISKEEESNIFYIQPCVTFSRSASLFLYPAQRWLWLSGDREDFQSLLGEQIKEALDASSAPYQKEEMIASPVIPSVENFLNQEAFLPPLRMHLRHSVVIRATLWFKSKSLVLFKYPSILKSSSDQKIPVGVVPFSLNSSTLGKVIHAIVSELPIEAEIMDAPGAKFWSISGENQEEIEKVIPAIFQTLHCGDTDKGEEIIECQILDAHEFFLISASLNRLPWRQTTRISRPYLFISQHCQPTALGEAIKRAIKNIREENPLKNFNR